MATIKNMHYDFKQKIKKIDSFKNRNFQIPEIDWKLNEAINLFVKMIAEPRYNQIQGFETSQRSIDDIRPLVVEDYEITPIHITAVDDIYSAVFPANYMHHLSSVGKCVKGSCIRNIRTIVTQHDDKDDRFHVSSFEWEELNMLISGNNIRIKTDRTFTVQKVYLTYIKQPLYVHNAADYPGGTYTLPDGTVLSGTQDCELSADILSEIVDIAVLITTGDMVSNYQIMQSKLQITN